MKTSLTTLILSSILFTALNSSFVYRLIIIDNGFQINEYRNLLNYQIKNFSSLLFKIPKEKYKIPSEKNNFEEIKELPEYTGFIKYFYDELSWEFVSNKNSKVRFKLITDDPFSDFCYPTESFQVKQDFFGEKREYKVKNGQNTLTFQNGSVFPPFLGFFSQKNVGENTGFSVNMDSTQFSFLKNVYFIEDFESELEEVQISTFNVSKSHDLMFVMNWEDIIVDMKIEKGASGEDLSKYSNKVVLKDDANKLRLIFLDKNGFHLGFENTMGVVLTSFRNGYYANSIIYCEILLDGFKRYFYKTEIPARSINLDNDWENQDPVADDGSLQKVADNCFNYGMDAQINSNSDLFNRRIKYYYFYPHRNIKVGLSYPFTKKDRKTIELDRINHILLTIDFVSYFEEDEEVEDVEKKLI